MRVLVTIPHFYRPSSEGLYSSETADFQSRAKIVSTCVAAIHQTCGENQRVPTYEQASPALTRANRSIRAKVDVVICTAGKDHLIESLATAPFRHHQTEADPRLLGYECHRVLADALGAYDYYCYLEDDLVIQDPLFFQKLRWFMQQFGEKALLQPNRYCITETGWKHYVEPIRRSAESGSYESTSTVVEREFIGVNLKFRRPKNPHSGCFFLTTSQMRYWCRRPYFLDRSSDFVGPLESAATLGIVRTFVVYKPDEENAGFLEILDSGATSRVLGRPLLEIK